MEITREVPVTIEIDEPNICSSRCQFFEDLSGGELGCRRYGNITDGRHADCISEFGTGEKPAVVQWEDSNIGDVVLVRACENSRTLRVNMEEGFERCSKCYFGIEDLTCPVSPDDENVALCETHLSACQVYFTTGSKE